MNKYIIAASLTLAIFGCGNDEQEAHKSYGNWEPGVRIVVMLEGGGVATLVCPRYKSQPPGGHGVQCYIQGDKQ